MSEIKKINTGTRTSTSPQKHGDKNSMAMPGQSESSHLKARSKSISNKNSTAKKQTETKISSSQSAAAASTSTVRKTALGKAKKSTGTKPGSIQAEKNQTLQNSGDMKGHLKQAEEQKDDKQMEEEDDYDEEDDDMAGDVIMMDQEIQLPRAPVRQLITEKLPKNARIHTSSKDLIIKLALQFLNTLSAKANDICNERNKKTVCSDHVLDALYKMNLGHYMAKIADPKMTAKREKTFLKQKQAKQKSEVMARLQRESDVLKRKGARQNHNESGDEGKQEQMFAEAAREMLIQNQDQIAVDFNNMQSELQQENQIPPYPMFGYDQNGMPALPFMACQTLQDLIMQTDFMLDEHQVDQQQFDHQMHQQNGNDLVQDFDAEIQNFGSKDSHTNQGELERVQDQVMGEHGASMGAEPVEKENGIKNHIQNIKSQNVQSIQMVKETNVDPQQLEFAFDEDSEENE